MMLLALGRAGKTPLLIILQKFNSERATQQQINTTIGARGGRGAEPEEFLLFTLGHRQSVNRRSN